MAKPLENARKRATTNPARITNLIYGGSAATKRRREIVQIFESDPIFSNHGRPFLNHTNRYLASIAKCQAFHLKCEALGLTDPLELRWAYQAVDDILPTDVHSAMFIPALEYQTSEAQKELWLPLAKSFRILGAYVQTELGHGSNVRALETTATFDLASDSFVINTPSTSATKWWPGGLGKTATHCVLHARLLLPSKNKNGTSGELRDMGVHAFFVPLRCMETHAPLPGITLGDIGPKLGFNSIDNGYAQFSNVPIPRFNLLAGVAVVHPDGSYERVRGGEKRMYGSMLDVRANIVSGAATALAKACTIAVRYSLARKQGYRMSRGGGGDGSDDQEVSVLEHPTQRRLALPWIAWCFALHFTGMRFRHHYNNFLKGDESVPLATLHAESSGLKALITQRVNDAIESLRKLCGGHGYSHLSGLPELSANYLALATLEGTQQVLEPQTARFLLRAHALANLAKGAGAAAGGGGGKRGAATPFSSATPYLFPQPSKAGGGGSGGDLSAALCKEPTDFTAHLSALGLRAKLLADAAAAELAHKAAALLATSLSSSPSSAAAQKDAAEKAALSQCGVALGRLSRAHSEFVLMNDFVDAVQAMSSSSSSSSSSSGAMSTQGQQGQGQGEESEGLGPAERTVFSHLCSLFGLHLLTSGECQAELLRLQVLTPEAAAACEAALDGDDDDDGNGGDAGGASASGVVLASVEKEALALVEAWDFTDASLGHSAIGSRDGDYAERLLEYASSTEPLNQAGFDAHLKYIRMLTGSQRAKL